MVRDSCVREKVNVIFNFVRCRTPIVLISPLKEKSLILLCDLER